MRQPSDMSRELFIERMKLIAVMIMVLFNGSIGLSFILLCGELEAETFNPTVVGSYFLCNAFAFACVLWWQFKKEEAVMRKDRCIWLLFNKLFPKASKKELRNRQ